MSRSRRKSPVRPITAAESEKKDKRVANRKQRRANKRIFRATGDDTQLKTRKELSDPWNMDKDGKARFRPEDDPKSMRK